MTRTRDVISRRPDGETTTAIGKARILRPDSITAIFRSKPEKRRRRVLEPKLFTRTTDTEWELYICIYREGEFRRFAMPLEQAEGFLGMELARVTDAIANRRLNKTGKDDVP